MATIQGPHQQMTIFLVVEVSEGEKDTDLKRQSMWTVCNLPTTKTTSDE
jgi:hypothetical protein